MTDIRLRPVRESDAPALAAIYAPYVRETAITFEYEPPDAGEFRRRLAAIAPKYPYLVAERDGEVLGYAYTSAFRTYTERFGPLYMEAVRETAEDPDGRRVLAEQLLDLLEAGWKRQRPWNRTMVQAREKQMLVTYLSPMLLGLEEPLCQELAERLRDGWNTRRPKDIYNITTYARLQEGFRNVILGIDITGWQKRREEES